MVCGLFLLWHVMGENKLKRDFSELRVPSPISGPEFGDSSGSALRFSHMVWASNVQ